MKVVVSSRLPLWWKRMPGMHGVLLESNVALTSRSRLLAKLIVFKSKKDLRNFWKKGLLKHDLGAGCMGAVNSLCCERVSFHPVERRRMEVDARFFCIIGLTQRNLSMEVISHEAMHAGFAYAKRMKRNPWASTYELDEEGVCYPAGRIASWINRVLHKNGIYR